MDAPFWIERWTERKLGWHKSDVNRNLAAHAARLLDSKQSGARVLVPLCGKTVDLVWLAEQGHQAVGIEIAHPALTQFFAEHPELGAPTTDKTASGHLRMRAGAVTMICSDIFKLSAADVGPIDGVWDRAAMVALPPDLRPRYNATIASLAPSAPILLNTFTYDEAVMDGPPFSIDDAEIEAAFASRTIELLTQADVLDEVSFKDRGHTYWTSTTFLLR